MNRLLVAAFLLAWSLAASAQGPLLLQPLWLQLKVAEIEQLPPQRPPRSIVRAVHEGKTVYYVSAACCDIPSELYDEKGTLLCFPDGGFAGGDGRCPGFKLAGTAASTVWRDARSKDSPGQAAGSNIDLLLIALHLLFWSAFALTRFVLARKAPASQPTQAAAAQVHTAPYSKLLLAFHMLAFAVMYFGVGAAVLPGRVPQLFAGQRIAGGVVIALGGLLACWALTSFASWRFRARLDPDHRLATGGAFRVVRHPIYLALNLLALGTALWAPTPTVGASALLMVIGSEMRARAEEKLLAAAFGAAYADYCKRTRRFLPGIY